MLKKLSLRQKLITSFTIVSLMTLLVGLIGVYSIVNLSKYIDELSNITIPSIINIEIQKVAQIQIRVKLRTFMSPYLTREEYQKELDEISDIREFYQAALDEYDKIEKHDREEELYQDFLNKLEISKNLNNQYFEKARGFLDADVDNQKLAEELYQINLDGQIGDAFAEMLSATDNLLEYIKTVDAEELAALSVQEAERARVLIIIATIISFIVAITLGIFIGILVSTPIARITKELSGSSDALEAASGQVANSSNYLSSSSSELSASVEEITSSMEELQSIIENNTKNTVDARNKLNEATVNAKDNMDSIQKLMNDINEIDTKATDVSKIIKVIDDIAFQTNILALNASVEAARAGEYGGGFAVVAEQVKVLANKSAEAAKESANMIEKMNDSVKRGKGMSESVLETITKSVDNFEKVSQLMEEIKTASGEQSKGANQVTKGTSEINSSIQQTASTAEENASAGEELSSQVEGINQIVIELQNLTDGEGNHTRRSSKRRKNADEGNRSNSHARTGQYHYDRPSENGFQKKKESLALSHKEDEEQGYPKQKSYSKGSSQEDDGVDLVKPEDVIPMDDFKDF